MLAGKTKFLAAGLKKGFSAVQEFGYFCFLGSIWSFFLLFCDADFRMVWRREGHTLPEKTVAAAMVC